MKFVCPLPVPWDEIYQALKERWEHGGKKSPPPPVPLILNGWVFSNDVEKAKRWRQTLDWAETYGLESLIPGLRDDQKYMVSDLSSYRVGPMGGPMFLPWDLETKEIPSDSEVQEALEKLKWEWDLIVGHDLARITSPVALTGKKKRRLLIKADKRFKPPWGDWDYLGPGEERRTFTYLRRSVNGAISPLEVDHIDFDTTMDWQG